MIASASERTPEGLVPLTHDVQNRSEYRFIVQVAQHWVFGNVGIAEETRVNARSQHTESRRFVAQHRIRLCNLVPGLWIADSSLPDFPLQLSQKIQPFFFAVLDRVAKSLADSPIQGGIEFVCAIESFEA